MAWFVVDVESDGPCPGLHSMVCFGAVRVDDELNERFYAKTAPVSDIWLPDSLAVSGFSREEHLAFPPLKTAMEDFCLWLEKVGGDSKPVFISDNPAFDWQFINSGLWHSVNKNPFGWSARRVGDLWSGMKMDCRDGSWRSLVKTAHTHHPVDDAVGVAEALLEMEKMGLKIPLGLRRQRVRPNAKTKASAG